MTPSSFPQVEPKKEPTKKAITPKKQISEPSVKDDVKMTNEDNEKVSSNARVRPTVAIASRKKRILDESERFASFCFHEMDHHTN
jgi:hypothetical protein